jgi:hypothetical protein
MYHNKIVEESIIKRYKVNYSAAGEDDKGKGKNE